MSGERRYAIYYTPPADHPLTRAAARWLGRDAFAGEAAASLSGDSDALVAEPRRYGFHATLKAPFRLRPGRTGQELGEAIRQFAESRPPCPIGPLRIARLGAFFALVPREPSPGLQALAARVVSDFDPFRAPMTPEELQRRLRASLDEAETTHLVQWGYPYVFDRFRFHMTLTGPVGESEREDVAYRLDAAFAPLLDEDFHVDALTLFEQPEQQSGFVVTARFGLGMRRPERARA